MVNIVKTFQPLYSYHKTTQLHLIKQYTKIFFKSREQKLRTQNADISVPVAIIFISP